MSVSENNDFACRDLLYGRGYTIDDKYCIHLPSPSHRMTGDEGAAIDYLCDEWDYEFSAGGKSS